MKKNKQSKYFILNQEPTAEQLALLKNQSLETIPVSKDGSHWCIEYVGEGIPKELENEDLCTHEEFMLSWWDKF